MASLRKAELKRRYGTGLRSVEANIIGDKSL